MTLQFWRRKNLGCGNDPCFPRKSSRNGGCSGGRCIYQGIYTLYQVLDCRTHRSLVILEPGSSFRLPGFNVAEARAASNSFRSASGARRHHQDTGVLFRRWSWYDRALFTRSHLQNVRLCVCLSTLHLVPFLGFGACHTPVWRFSVLKLWIIWVWLQNWALQDLRCFSFLL